ncbi:hypothetical protein AC1031_010654 [Aphanomyces cochlioides]|nr:hypothetical protein AC1031_010654 [Aphanomyces cochlioides]
MDRPSLSRRMRRAAKRKLSETKPTEYDELMAQGKLLRSTASRIPTQDSLYSSRLYYLNQALDTFQQALNLSSTETQECLEQIRETQIDLMVLSKLAQNVVATPKQGFREPLRVTVRHRPLLPDDAAPTEKPLPRLNPYDWTERPRVCPAPTPKTTSRLHDLYEQKLFPKEPFPLKAASDDSRYDSYRAPLGYLLPPLAPRLRSTDEENMEQMLSIAQTLVSIAQTSD